jgi:Fe-coproporphyrin III synthase
MLVACLGEAVALGYTQLSISGGEPLLYRPLAELLRQARALGMTTSLTSNGTLLDNRRWAALAPLIDTLAVSIDGRPREHDALRASDGAFERTRRNLRGLRATRANYGLIFTLTQHNVDSLEFVVRLAAEHGARQVQVHPLTLHGRAATTLLGSRPDGLELSAALAEALRLGAELGVHVHVDAVAIDQLTKHRRAMVPERPVSHIAAVAPLLVVQPDGTVQPLTHELAPQLGLGSLRNAPLSLLVAGWLAAGHADTLALLCEQTYRELTGEPDALAYYWYDEVAVRSRRPDAAGPPRLQDSG